MRSIDLLYGIVVSQDILQSIVVGNYRWRRHLLPHENAIASLSEKITTGKDPGLWWEPNHGDRRVADLPPAEDSVAVGKHDIVMNLVEIMTEQTVW